MDIEKEGKVENLISDREEEEVGTDVEKRSDSYTKVAPIEEVSILVNINQGNSNLPRGNTNIPSIDVLSPKKQKELIALLHSKTETIGDFDTSDKTFCPCCNKQIPAPFKWNKIFRAHELANYGIDLLNFNSILKIFMTFLKYFWMVIIALSFLSIMFNIDRYFTDIKQYFQGKKYDVFILDFFFYYYFKRSFIQGVGFLIFAGIFIVLFLKIHQKIKLNKKKYRMNLLGNKEIEETLFSVFVKNLPKLTDIDDLKNFLETEYKVSIHQIIMLNDYEVLESLRKKLLEYKETGDFTMSHLNSIKEEIEKFSKNIEYCGAAIIIFNDNEDRLLFFREFFNLKEVLYMYFKRHFIYRGRKIYFEPVPSIKMIDWNNVKYSLEKVMSNTKLQYIVSFLFSASIYAFAYYTITVISMVQIITDGEALNSFVKNILILVLNFVLKYGLVLMIESFKLSDNYMKEILRSYFVAQRNTNNTVFINLLIFATFESDKKWSIIFLILLQNAKMAVLCRYSAEYLFRIISYKLYLHKKMNTQETLNKALGENNFNFMTAYENFKICFYLTVFVLIKSPTIGLIATAMLYLHLLAIRFSFTRSRFKDFSTNYYGFYFTYTLDKEFLLTGKFFITYTIANFLPASGAIFLIFNGVADFALDVINSKSFYTKFWVKKKYDEVEFTKKFNTEKFVNLDIYVEEVNKLFSTLENKP